MDIANIRLLFQTYTAAISPAELSIDRNGETFASTAITNVTDPAYKPGTTVTVYDEQAGGYCQFTYLKYDSGDIADALAVAGLLCALKEAEDYVVTADGDNVGAGAFPAVMLAAMTSGGYGWFWTGGVCPLGLVSGLKGQTLTPAATVAIGDSIMLLVTANSVKFTRAASATPLKPIIGYVKAAENI